MIKPHLTWSIRLRYFSLYSFLSRKILASSTLEQRTPSVVIWETNTLMQGFSLNYIKQVQSLVRTLQFKQVTT